MRTAQIYNISAEVCKRDSMEFTGENIQNTESNVDTVHNTELVSVYNMYTLLTWSSRKN
jgi:hypothetical protein